TGGVSAGKDAEVSGNADPSEIRRQKCGVFVTNWTARAPALCRLLVGVPIFPGGGILILVLAATDPRKPRNQPQPVENEHQDHKRHKSYAAIHYVSHLRHPYYLAVWQTFCSA